MTLYRVTRVDCCGAHTERIGETQQTELSVGDRISYKTNKGETLETEKVEKKNHEFDEDILLSKTYYTTTDGRMYEIVDEEKRRKHYEKLGIY